MWQCCRGPQMGPSDEINGDYSPLRLGGMEPQRFPDPDIIAESRSLFGPGVGTGNGGCEPQLGGDDEGGGPLLTPMHFRAVVNAVASRYIKNIDASELLKTRRMFLDWKSEPDKLNVMLMYRHSGWRAVYTQNLFLPRIQTVEYTMQRLLDIQSPRVLLTKAVKYVSLGCGPGPCISAVMLVLRRDLGVTHELSFTGVDQFIGWKPYIESLNAVDQFSTVGFQQLVVNEDTVDDVPQGDVAIMSYTDAAVHTPAFWEGLQKRYSLILILDQNKSSLGGLLRRQEFRMVNYHLKGHKRFYYRVCPRKSKQPAAKAADKDGKTSEQQVCPLSQMRELKSVESGLKGSQGIVKTKCGAKTGKYSGALEPQKRMTAERMNQLLRAKLLAMEETTSPEGSPSSIKTESCTEESCSNSSQSTSLKVDSVKQEEYTIPVLSRAAFSFPDDFPMEFRNNPIFQEDSDSNPALEDKPAASEEQEIPRLDSLTVEQSRFDLRQVLSHRNTPNFPCAITPPPTSMAQHSFPPISYPTDPPISYLSTSVNSSPYLYPYQPVTENTAYYPGYSVPVSQLYPQSQQMIWPSAAQPIQSQQVSGQFTSPQGHNMAVFMPPPQQTRHSATPTLPQPRKRRSDERNSPSISRRHCPSGSSDDNNDTIISLEKRDLRNLLQQKRTRPNNPELHLK